MIPSRVFLAGQRGVADKPEHEPPWLYPGDGHEPLQDFALTAHLSSMARKGWELDQ